MELFHRAIISQCTPQKLFQGAIVSQGTPQSVLVNYSVTNLQTIFSPATWNVCSYNENTNLVKYEKLINFQVLIYTLEVLRKKIA